MKNTGAPSAPSSVSVRRAEDSDADLLIEWRNDPTTRASSRDGSAVTPDAHRRWLERVLGDPDRLLLIGLLDGTPVGTVRFDRLRDGREPAAVEVSVTVAPEHRGRGLAVPLLQAAEARLAHDLPDARLLAYVKSANEASVALFRTAGYGPIETDATGQWLAKDPG